jgi:hypothetical protein
MVTCNLRSGEDLQLAQQTTLFGSLRRRGVTAFKRRLTIAKLLGNAHRRGQVGLLTAQVPLVIAKVL